jgi:hypothetical protein
MDALPVSAYAQCTVAQQGPAPDNCTTVPANPSEAICQTPLQCVTAAAL